MTRPSTVTVDREALAHNFSAMCDLVAPAVVCGVVKADGYGHGAATAGRAAVAGGAEKLAVALVQEAAELRDSGIDVPILLLSEPPADEVAEAISLGVDFVVATPEAIDAVAAGGRGARLHLKIDTGMHRVGCSPSDAEQIVDRIEGDRSVSLVGLATHCPVADEVDRTYTEAQIARFTALVDTLRGRISSSPIVHAANSAAAMAFPEARFDMVRVGIAGYGASPARHLDGVVDLRAAMELRSVVSALRVVDAGEGVSYGHRWRAERPTTIATVPLGYADGIRRSSGRCGVEVLHRGARRPVVGQVTMDQLMIALGGPEVDAAVGDEVVLIGAQGDEEITATEIADRLGTISYEVFCDLTPRLPRLPRN